MSTNAISDSKQRQHALDARQSFIVQAPAGSGKTELLTQRYLKLLSQAEKAPEEIIAITFTKKAAAEMRTRITLALERAKTPSESAQEPHKTTQQLALAVLKRDKTLEWGLTQNPNRLRIQTIDALCTQIASQLPIVSQFGASPTITEDATELYQKATEEFLQHLEEPSYPWANAIAQLLTYLNNNYARLQHLLTEMLKTRDQWLPYLAPMQNTLDAPEAIHQLLCQSLENIVKHHLKKLCDLQFFQNDACLLQLVQFAQQQLIADGSDHPLAQLPPLTTLPDFTIEQHSSWCAIADLFFTKELKWRKTLTKAQGFPPQSKAPTREDKQLYVLMKASMQDWLDTCANNAELTSVLHDVCLSPPTTYHPEQWCTLLALIEILPILAAQLTIVFRDHGTVDFIQVAQAALTALGDDSTPSDTALNLDYHIRHILFDEFQDTSLTQFQLLKKLTLGWQPDDGRTLFLVGDPMQSIYRFRQAEVGLFLQVQAEGIHDIPLTPLTLTHNFRSCQTIVDWTNHVFHALFPTSNQIDKGGIRYSPAIANQADYAHSQVSFHPIIHDLNEQANAIIQLLKQLRQEDDTQSIAILVRSRRHLFEITAALQQSSLPYQAIEIEPLTHQPFIQDLIALTRALDHLGDRIAWLALLRAPWCGLTLNDIHTIAEASKTTTLWDILTQYHSLFALSQDTSARLAIVVPILQHAFITRTEKHFARWVHDTWLALGGMSLLENPGDDEDASVYFDTLHTLTHGAKPLDIEKLMYQLNQRYATTLSTHPHPIQIMTIHKSKGLEFDTVIMPALDKRPRGDTPDLLACEQSLQDDGAPHMIMAPIHAHPSTQEPIYQYLRRTQQQKQDFEAQRLLYVAITRAKHQLHLFGQVTLEEGSHTIKAVTGKSFLAQLWPFLNASVNNAAIDTTSTLIDTTTPSTSLLKRCTLPWLEAFHHSHEKPVVAPKTNADLQLRSTAQLTSMAIGTLVHRYLQCIADQGLDAWPLSRLQAQIPNIRSSLAILGVKPSDMAEAQDSVIKALGNTLCDDIGQWILGKHIDAQAEYAVYWKKGSEWTTLVVDRTFVDSDGIRWIVDYKTSTPSEGQSREAFISEQYQRYAPQLDRYASAMASTSPQTIKCGLYFPLLQTWCPLEERLTCP